MNSLSYHESHSHGSLGLPFQAYSQEDPYGQYFVPYHWHEEVEFIYVTKGSLVLRTQNRTRLLQEGHIYFINPGTLHGLFGNSPFSRSLGFPSTRPSSQTMVSAVIISSPGCNMFR